MLIKKIPNIKEVLRSALDLLKKEKVVETVLNVHGNAPTTNEIQVLKDIKIKIEELEIRLTETNDIYQMIITYNGEQVNYHTENKEINELLEQISEEFFKKCK